MSAGTQKRPHFVTRTIRDGRVRILGGTYVCREDASRFDGTRAIFGLYWGPPNYERYDARGLMDGVCLWGCEEDEWPGRFCDEAGFFRWENWVRAPFGAPA